MAELIQTSIDSPQNAGIVQLLGFHSELPGSFAGFGTGIAISRNYILTAAHNLFVFESSEFRPDGSGGAAYVLPARSEIDTLSILFGREGSSIDHMATVSADEGRFAYLRSYNLASVRTDELDLELVRLDAPIALDGAVLKGLAGFASSDGMLGAPVRIAGYPSTQLVSGADGQSLFESDGSVTDVSELQLEYDDTFAAPGMSGGPVFIEDFALGELIGGVHTTSAEQGRTGWHVLIDGALRWFGDLFGSNETGARLTLSDITAIMTLLEPLEGATDAATLPANLLVGSDSILTLFGNDAITGSYRRDVIRGLGGEDQIEGRGSHDQIDGGAGDDILIGDGFDVGAATDSQGLPSFDVVGNDFLDGGSGYDTVRTGWDHNDGVHIEIGNSSAHEDVFDRSGFSNISLSSDVVVVEGVGGTDFIRNVEIIDRSFALIPGAEVPPAQMDSASDTLKLHAFDATVLGQLETIDLAGGRDVIDLGALASGMSVTLDSEARYTLARMDGSDGALVVWNANAIAAPLDVSRGADVRFDSHLNVVRRPSVYCGHNVRGGALAT